MARKRAQFGLDTLMSYLLFAVFLIFTILALTLSGCGSNKKKIAYGLDSEKGVMAELRASEQLTAFLNTKMPEKGDLYRGIDGAKDKLGAQASFNAGNARGFLDEHPEVYAHKTYGGFISALYFYRLDGRSRDVFDAVTKAMFFRHRFSAGKRELNDGKLDEMYYFPIMGVQEGRHKMFDDGLGTVFGESGVKFLGDSAAKELPTQDAAGLTVYFMDHLVEDAEPVP